MAPSTMDSRRFRYLDVKHILWTCVNKDYGNHVVNFKCLKRVKITVKAVYGTVNNGFKEIQIFGC